MRCFVGGFAQPDGRARPHDIARPDIGVDRGAGQRRRVIRRVDILHQSAGDSILAHAVQRARTQSCKFDRTHPLRRIEAAGERAAHQDVTPARNHRPLDTAQGSTDDGRGLARERAGRQAALGRRNNSDFAGGPARGRRNIVTRSKAQSFVQFRRAHRLQFLDRRNVAQAHAGCVDGRGRARQGLHDFARSRRAFRRRRRGRSRSGGRGRRIGCAGQNALRRALRNHDAR